MARRCVCLARLTRGGGVPALTPVGQHAIGCLQNLILSKAGFFDGSQRNEDCEMLSDRQKSCAPEIWLAAAASEASSRISSPHKARFLLFFASQMAGERGKNSCSNNSASVGFEAKLWSAANKRRALIQMATGSGKTYTAVNFVYRLIKLAGARRVLFLVDRGNLGDQTLKIGAAATRRHPKERPEG